MTPSSSTEQESLSATASESADAELREAENVRLRHLVVELSSIVLKNVVALDRKSTCRSRTSRNPSMLPRKLTEQA
jgi:hypothetical protein